MIANVVRAAALGIGFGMVFGAATAQAATISVTGFQSTEVAGADGYTEAPVGVSFLAETALVDALGAQVLRLDGAVFSPGTSPGNVAISYRANLNITNALDRPLVLTFTPDFEVRATMDANVGGGFARTEVFMVNRTLGATDLSSVTASSFGSDGGGTFTDRATDPFFVTVAPGQEGFLTFEAGLRLDTGADASAAAVSSVRTSLVLTSVEGLAAPQPDTGPVGVVPLPAGGWLLLAGLSGLALLRRRA